MLDLANKQKEMEKKDSCSWLEIYYQRGLVCCWPCQACISDSKCSHLLTSAWYQFVCLIVFYRVIVLRKWKLTYSNIQRQKILILTEPEKGFVRFIAILLKDSSKSIFMSILVCLFNLLVECTPLVNGSLFRGTQDILLCANPEYFSA